jgi:hypothetical protein
MALPTGLGYFKVTWQVLAGIADEFDADDEPDVIPVGGQVIFTPSQASLNLLTASMKASLFLGPVVATTGSDGILRSNQGNPWVSLIAPDSDGLTEKGWTWGVTFKVDGYTKQSFSFNAVSGATYDLAELVPTEVSAGTITVRGPVGPEGPPAVIGVPPYAGTRVHTWDPALCIYNSESPKLRSLRSIIRGARAGGPAKRLLAAGDSKTAGAGTGGAASTLSMPAQLMDLLGGKQGYVQVNVEDNQWSLGSGLGYSTDPAQAFIQFPSNGGTLTFTPRSDITFTGFRIAAYGGGYSANGGSLSVTVDGGAPITQTVDIDPGNFHYLTAVTGLADTAHTITITCANNAVLISGIELTYASTNGLRVINAGRDSTDASNWLPVNWSTIWGATFGNTIFPVPDAAILALGTNNNGTATPAMLGQVAGNIDALGIPLLLVAFGGIPNSADLDARRAALYDAADTYDLPLVDFTALIGNNAKATAAGLMADAVHENQRGCALEAQALARIISPA